MVSATLIVNLDRCTASKSIPSVVSSLGMPTRDANTFAPLFPILNWAGCSGPPVEVWT